jgi:ubiquitin C-terminal hydrolase
MSKPGSRPRNSKSYRQSVKAYEPPKPQVTVSSSWNQGRKHSPQNQYSPPSPSTPHGSSNEQRRGLKNLGNTCFANAALQCILNTPVLIAYLTTDDMQGSNISKFTRALSNLFKTQWSYSQNKIDPLPVLQLVWNNSQLFQQGQQNDAHEFLLYLLDQLHEELRRPYLDYKSSCTEKSEKSWEDYMKKNFSIISKEFQGQTKTKLECNECRYLKNRYEPFMYLSLSIPAGSQPSLEDCLDEFCQEDKLNNAEKWYCKKCEKLVEATKQSEIIRVPRYLIIHLKRFKDIYRKIDQLVDYGECLDMSKYSKLSASSDKALDEDLKFNDSNRRLEYRLYAKIKHMGSLKGGHYVAVIKQNESWYCFNDNQIQEVNFEPSPDTYLLFYELKSLSHMPSSISIDSGPDKLNLQDIQLINLNIP